MKRKSLVDSRSAAGHTKQCPALNHRRLCWVFASGGDLSQVMFKTDLQEERNCLQVLLTDLRMEIANGKN